jgi:hypothetical protein
MAEVGKSSNHRLSCQQGRPEERTYLPTVSIQSYQGGKEIRPTPVWSSIWTNIPKSNHMLGLKPIYEAQEPGTFDSADRQK